VAVSKTDDEKLEALTKSMGLMCLAAAKDPATLLSHVFDLIGQSNKVAKGMPKFVKAIDDGKIRNDQLAQMLRTTTKHLGEMCENLNHLAVAVFIYVAGESFLSDTTRIATRCGYGEQAIRAMAKAKFGNADFWKGFNEAAKEKGE
jgi:hypothetical protein